MKKTVGVLSGLVVAVAAVCTAGAWYTGKQLPEVLDNAIAQSNVQLKQSMVGVGGSANLELISLESHLYSSTARYRIKVNDLMVGDEPHSFELGFVDRIEHGPLPWTRLKALKLMPVMAASNYTLEKDASSAELFVVSGGVAPLQGQTSLGYDGSTDSTVTMPPMQWTDAGGSVLKFSGLEVRATGTKDAGQVTFNGHSANVSLNVLEPGRAPWNVEVSGLKLTGDMSKTEFGYYVGTSALGVAETKAVLGEQQKVLVIKQLEQNAASEINGDTLTGKVAYKVGDINFDAKPVGSSEMLLSFKRIDVPAMQSLIAWYQKRLPELQAAQARGQAMPSVPMTEAEKAQVSADVQKVLAAKPQFALENLSFKTANGESRFSLSVDLDKPASLELPQDELYRQMITQVQSKLQLSKPMIGDLAALQARLQGQSEAQIQAQQVAQTGEMVGMIALQSQMATVQGNDILSSVHYADGMVDLNGQKMTVEQFAHLIMANLGALQPRG
ncbi:YdgA family protein [Pseudomonas vranovensis]|uniref:YdgA family protein n=1 Tax=Pseudomonas vranovensis TaxID=321661 RepID=UPI0004115DFA|nr:YdgA family protein [Pseudomonas vranovensis]